MCIAVEWSVNEKGGARIVDRRQRQVKRSLVGDEDVGRQRDGGFACSRLPIAACCGAMVIYTVDDVGVHYYMVEQDAALRPAHPDIADPAHAATVSKKNVYYERACAFTLSEHTGVRLRAGNNKGCEPITAMKVGQHRPAKAIHVDLFPRETSLRFTKAAPQWCRDQHSEAHCNGWNRLRESCPAMAMMRTMYRQAKWQRRSQLLRADIYPSRVPTERMPAVFSDSCHRTGRSWKAPRYYRVRGPKFQPFRQRTRAQRSPQWFANVPVLKLGW